MTINKLSSLAVIIVSAIITLGCAAPKMYYWEDYSKSLYNYKKTPSDETMARHKQGLLKIIEVSQQNNMRVPPGVCCEYAYILMKDGKNEEALKYLIMEEQSYPESAPFIKLLKNKIEVKKDGKTS